MHIVEFLIASVVLTLLPGPDILYVMTQSLTRNARAGITVALGLCSGLFVHTSAAALGISLIIANTPWLFELIKYAGVAYMVYMGWMGLQSFYHSAPAGESVVVAGESKMGYAQLYRTGIIMNVLNPKVIFFFLAFLPQFVAKEARNTALDIFMLGGLFAFQAIILFSLVALIAGWLSVRLSIQTVSPRKLSLIRAVVYFSIAILFLVK